MASVLVIDDERSIRETLALILDDAGYEVQLASSLSEARALIGGARPPEVVITDLVMPEASGLEVLDEVKACCAGAKVILITGHPSVDTAAEALRRGASDYLEKPVRAQVVLRAVASAAKISRLEQDNSRYQQRLESLVDERTAQLEASEARFRALVDGSPVGIFEHQQGKLSYANRRLAELLAVEDVKALLGREVLTLIAPEDRERVLERVRLWNGGGTPPNPHEVRLLGDDGEVRWVEMRVDRHIAQGHFIGSAVDIAERIAATRALEQSEARYRLLTEQQQDVVASVSAAGLLTYCSPAIRPFGGYDPEEVLGAAFSEFITEDDRAAALEAFERTLSEDTALTFEFAFLPKDGQPFPAEVSGTLLRGEDGSVQGAQLIVRDLRPRRRMEQEREQLQKQVQQMQRLEAVGQLAGGVAHDFNNILTAISSYVDLLAMDLPPKDERQEDLREIREATQRGSWLTSQLLAFSKLQVIQPRPLRLDQQAQRAVRLLRRLLGERIDLELSAEGEPWTVRADPGQIDQIMLNLATNARDAMPNGGTLLLQIDNVRINAAMARALSTERQGEFVRLRVQDSGTGMSPATRARIFEPFFSTKEVGEGTGLGLATVYGIVSQNDGLVDVQSREGVGSCFDIYLPRCDEAPDDEGADAEHAPAARADNREAVLLAEDETMVRRATARILRHAGYRVHEAGDGVEALEVAERQPVDVVVSDVVMPRMDGGALLSALRRRRPELRALFVSGYAADFVERHTTLDAQTRYLQKPYAAQQLLEQLRTLLDA